MEIDFTKFGHGVESLVPSISQASGHGVVPVAGIESLNAYARAVLAMFDAEIVIMEGEAAAFDVKTDDDAREATERVGRVKSFIKRFDDRRKEIIADADSFVRKVNQAVKPKRDRLFAIERRYKQLLGDHAHRVEIARREMIRRQEEERAKLQAALDKEAAEKNVEPVIVAAPVAVPTKQGPTRSESATASTVMVWDFEVVDPAKVPRMYLAVDPAAIRAAIKAGIREIDGVKIFETARVQVRRI